MGDYEKDNALLLTIKRDGEEETILSFGFDAEETDHKGRSWAQGLYALAKAAQDYLSLNDCLFPDYW